MLMTLYGTYLCMFSLFGIGITHAQTNGTVKEIRVPIAVQEQGVYEHSIHISADNPAITDITFTSSMPAQRLYDNVLKETSVFPHDVDLIVTFNEAAHTTPAALHIMYQVHPSKTNVATWVDLPLQQTIQQPNNQLDAPAPTSATQPAMAVSHSSKPAQKQTIWESLQGIGATIQRTINITDSWFWRFIAVFLLGILMSLTPCIYPMIPITAGILQSYGSKSFLSNFIVSLAYAFGIATTFATFGLIAASTGHLFGNLLMNPIFVICMVIFLAYMGLTMLDVVNLYVPKAFTKNHAVQSKYFVVSAFLLGVMSGTVASPCLTPGLAFLLTLVATLGSKLLGFFLLFTAGIGLSLPLLLIGTFSSSLSVLPKAGMWMVEIKKLFAFILFGMCFYFLKNIMPETMLLIALAIFLFISGVYFFITINRHTPKAWRVIKNFIALICIVLAVVTGGKAWFNYHHSPAEVRSMLTWHTDYAQAQALAQQENKSILIDIGADFCSICKAIDKQVFADPTVQLTLQHFVLVKVNASTDQQLYAALKQRYAVLGVPTILVIDAQTEAQRARWGAELYGTPRETFISALQELR